MGCGSPQAPVSKTGQLWCLPIQVCELGLEALRPNVQPLYRIPGPLDTQLLHGPLPQACGAEGCPGPGLPDMRLLPGLSGYSPAGEKPPCPFARVQAAHPSECPGPLTCLFLNKAPSTGLATGTHSHPFPPPGHVPESGKAWERPSSGALWLKEQRPDLNKAPVLHSIGTEMIRSYSHDYIYSPNAHWLSCRGAGHMGVKGCQGPCPEAEEEEHSGGFIRVPQEKGPFIHSTSFPREPTASLGHRGDGSYRPGTHRGPEGPGIRRHRAR